MHIGAGELLTDDQLVSGVIQRDRNALSLFYDRYGALSYSICIQLTKDALEAEKFTEEIFLCIPELISCYKSDRLGLGEWTAGITRYVEMKKTRAVPGALP